MSCKSTAGTCRLLPERPPSSRVLRRGGNEEQHEEDPIRRGVPGARSLSRTHSSPETKSERLSAGEERSERERVDDKPTR